MDRFYCGNLDYHRSFIDNLLVIEAWLIILVGAAYLLGVQGITVAIHIPLNNHIQKLNIEELNDKTLADER
ncbi:MAG: hypothetical protein CM15mP54_14290 [Paracoccaceae bacterium]|nr:MAG: hypothetical protein CM15mP54_14290 [Paracoccaceae bacterium]